MRIALFVGGTSFSHFYFDDMPLATTAVKVALIYGITKMNEAIFAF